MKQFKEDVKELFKGFLFLIFIMVGAGWLFTGFGMFLIIGSLLRELHWSIGTITLILNLWMFIARYNDIPSPTDLIIDKIT